MIGFFIGNNFNAYFVLIEDSQHIRQRVQNPDSILAVSEDGTLVYANKQFIEEYGVTQQMGIQKIYDLPVSLTTKEAWERRLQEIRDNDGTFAYRAAFAWSPAPLYHDT